MVSSHGDLSHRVPFALQEFSLGGSSEVEETSLFPEPGLMQREMGRGQGTEDLGASLPVWRPLLGNSSTQQQLLVISVWVCEDTEVLLSEQISMIQHSVISSIIIFHIRASPSLSYSWMFIPFKQPFPISSTPQPLATTFFSLFQ